ncbi:hypothetical protein OBBRIDRAFT_891812 [Obba rivulosa]|uniref:DUF6533 domain-containing protein n=1 Tax=Obba rivulosa TaxID=1052685 RepID=A0A8E2AH52_9APHY|nr:hypothetical protein OBBRIDRAFT_891812 [Obba rivulosa]
MATTNAQIISELSQNQIVEYCDLAVAVLIFHEYLATFTMEVEVIWTRKLSNLTTVLFLINRYNSLLQALISATSLNIVIRSNMGCRVWAAVVNGPEFVFFATWALFCALRVYSLNTRKLLYASVVLGVGLVPLGINLYPVIKQVATSSLFEGSCVLNWVPPLLWDDMFTVASRGSVLICDVMVLYSTLSNTWSLRTARDSTQVKSSLVTLMVWNGTFYFVAALCLNSIQAALWTSNTFEFFGAFTTQITSVMISRFILQLRKIYFSSARPSFLNTQYSELSHLSALHFATIPEFTNIAMQPLYASCAVQAPPREYDAERLAMSCDEAEPVESSDLYEANRGEDMPEWHVV